MHKEIKILDHKVAFQGYFRVDEYQLRFRLFSGDWSQPITRELFERGNSAAVLLYDPVLDQIVFAQQFRIGALKDKKSPWLIELVAGVIEQGETPEDVVKREIHEESGLTFTDLFPITNYWVSPGGCSEHVSLFCARVDAKKAGGIHGLAEEHEDIRIFTMDAEQAFEAVRKGDINNGHTIIALQWLQINHKDLRDRWLLKKRVS